MRERIFGIALGLALMVGVPSFLFILATMTFATPMAGLISILCGVSFCAALVWIMSRSTLWPGYGWWVPAALLWGGGVSVAYTVPVTEITDKLGWEITAYSFGGAYPEELIKGVGAIVVLFSFARLNRPWHGLLAGFFVGVGFEVVENIMYGTMGAVLDPNSDLVGVLSMWGLRLVAGPLIHACLTGIVGWGVGLAVFASGKSRWWRAGVVLMAWFTAFAFHFTWNLSLPADWMQLVSYVVAGLGLYAALALCWLTAAKVKRTEVTLLSAGGINAS